MFGRGTFQVLQGAWLWAALAPLGGCLEVREEARAGEQNSCVSCHGEANPARDALLQSAPARDLMGNSSPDYPGVGAHAAHLLPGPTHAGVACAECHEVPTSVAAPGHADSALPAEVRFGALALGDSDASVYDPLTRRCSDTYCHGPVSPLWTESAEAPCGGCHELPPAAPHPQSDNCAACHSDVIDAARTIIAPALHVNGQVNLDELACDGCHGGPDNPAPPRSLSGETAPETRGVGAHQAHLAGGDQSRPLACSECHRVPEPTRSSTHPDGLGVQVELSGIAGLAEATPQWNAAEATCSGSYCHNPSGGPDDGVSWVLGSALACTACHGNPPAAPHPQVEDCGLCHGDVFSRELGVVERARHVDGVLDVRVPEDCTSCHGDGAAVIDSTDGLAGAAPQDGIHAAHVSPDGPVRRLACSECHQVPDRVFAPGHVDTPLPAEVRFSGVATAFEASPSFDAGTCADTFCHGGSFVGGRPSGGVETEPAWAPRPGSTGLGCQSCHGMPPPAPHPEDAGSCSTCHRNIDDTELFTAPDTHVDGIVTFFLSAP